MKKVLITMAVLTGLVAGGMMFSSFVTPKTNDETVCSQINANEGWTIVGTYTGNTDDGYKTKQFAIWEKEGICNAYHWTTDCNGYGYKNPDETTCSTGAVRKNSEGRWYCAFAGDNYFIDF